MTRSMLILVAWLLCCAVYAEPVKVADFEDDVDGKIPAFEKKYGKAIKVTKNKKDADKSIRTYKIEVVSDKKTYKEVQIYCSSDWVNGYTLLTSKELKSRKPRRLTLKRIEQLKEKCLGKTKPEIIALLGEPRKVEMLVKKCPLLIYSIRVSDDKEITKLTFGIQLGSPECRLAGTGSGDID